MRPMGRERWPVTVVSARRRDASGCLGLATAAIRAAATTASKCHALWACALAVATLGVSPQVLAADFAYSAFGTLGYAISDQDFRYLRYIDNEGTFKVDSLAGVQVDVRFTPEWSATVQGVVSAPRRRDDGLEAAVRWAFVSYRPTNDWLIRAGRLRPPVFIHTQNAEVGVTYDQARLPVEIYSLSPVYDIDGAAVAKTWSLDDAELNVEGYWGKADVRFRLPFQRHPELSLVPRPFFSEEISFKGLIVSHASGPLFLRAGFHHGRIRGERPVSRDFVATTIPLPPPVGGTLYAPGATVEAFNALLWTLGADWRRGPWRVTAEYGKRAFSDVEPAADTQSGYVTVAHALGKWTPYLTYARLLSSKRQRSLFGDINSTPVPLAAQGAPFFLPSNFHRALADQVHVLDQHSFMLGTSYSPSATSKVKLEWMRVGVGAGSNVLIDGDVRNKRFNVFSVSYSVSF